MVQQDLPERACVIINLENFDCLAHRGQTDSCASSLVAIDAFLNEWLPGMKDDDWLVVTGDHGVELGAGDLSMAHRREAVPVLCVRGRDSPLLTRRFIGYGVIGESIRDITMHSMPQALIDGR